MKTKIIFEGIKLIQQQCTNMVEIESVMYNTGISAVGRHNSLGDEIHLKVRRILFRTIPNRFKQSIMYKNLKVSLSI